MRKRQIHTSIHYDQKVRKLPWLETYVFIHLQVREELSTLGVIVTNPHSIANLMNGTDRNGSTPELPLIEARHIERALKNLSAKRMIMMENGTEWTIWLRNFLRYQDWGPTVVKSWPEQLRYIPSAKIERAVRKRARQYCREKKYKVPTGL